jgi:hypothetical protein
VKGRRDKMFANQLIGKKAIRTKPGILSPADDIGDIPSFFGIGTRKATLDYSFSERPILILAATESHIVFKFCNREERTYGADKHILDNRWCDENWTDYDELMKLAEPEASELMRLAHDAANGEGRENE